MHEKFSGSGVFPDALGDAADEAELRPLVFFREEIAFLRGGKTALRAEAEMVERHVFRRFADAGDDVFLILKLRRF